MLLKPNKLIQLIIDNVEKGSHFLDLGCGDGTDSLFMAQKGFNVTAVDSSLECINKLKSNAKIKNLNIVAICLKVENFYVKNGKYSIINAYNIFQFINKKISVKIIKNLKKAVRNNGYVIISGFTTKDPLFSNPKKKSLCFFKENELKNLFNDSKILYYQEKIINDPPHEGYESPHKHGVVRLVAQKTHE